MNTRNVNRGGGRRRSALSLSELLISLAITASLLTAIAAAFSSSATVIENNDKFFRATQAGRVAINQILAEVRRCDSVEVSPTQIEILQAHELRPANEKTRTIKYDAANKQLVLFITYMNDTKSANFPLAPCVVSPTPFSCDTAEDDNHTTYVTRVSVALEVKVGNNTVRLSGSAAPRRSLKFK
jgi:hypothetical protein